MEEKSKTWQRSKNSIQPLMKSDFDTLKLELKAFTADWVKKIVEKLKTKHPDTQYAKAPMWKVYKTFNCLTQSGSWRTVVYSAAKDVLKDLQEEMQQLKAD